MIDVHQNATLSESFEGDRSRVIGNRCKFYFFLYGVTMYKVVLHLIYIDKYIEINRFYAFCSVSCFSLI